MEYLWCGLPVIYNNYSELSDYIRDYNAGWVVDPEDREAITSVIQSIFDHPEDVAERGRNAQRLVHEQLNWVSTIKPIDSFIRNPTMRRHISPVQPGIPQFLEDKARYVQYLIMEAGLHYEKGGIHSVWQEGAAFVSRQIRWMPGIRWLNRNRK